jgi:CHAT domain-containing protein
MTRSSCAGLYALCTHAVRGAAYRRLDHRYRAARRGGTLASARQQPAQRTRRAEVGAITALFERAEVLRRKQADRPAVVAALLKAQVAHFACHGATDWDDPQQSGLILANDERLTVEALLRLQLTEARLAVLSACETGLIGRQLPDEVVGLPTAFLNVGFAGVLASLWSVADWSTAQLMAQFYLLWRGHGMAPSLALCAAQRWFRDTDDHEKAAAARRHLATVERQARPEPVVVPLWDARRRAKGLSRPDPQHPFWWAAFYLTGV